METDLITDQSEVPRTLLPNSGLPTSLPVAPGSDLSAPAHQRKLPYDSFSRRVSPVWPHRDNRNRQICSPTVVSPQALDVAFLKPLSNSGSFRMMDI